MNENIFLPDYEPVSSDGWKYFRQTQSFAKGVMYDVEKI